MNNGWIYTVDPLAEEPIMLINTHIGFDKEDGQGVDGAQFQSELLSLDGMGKKCIQVWINSPGGSVADGYNIYGAILKSKTKVDTYAVGMCASIAGVIFQAGRTRVMCDYGFLMYHDPTGSDDAKLLGVMKDSIATMTARSGKSEDDILEMMKKTTYINAEEAKEFGMCDTIEPSSEHNKKRMAQAPVTAKWNEANKIINKLINTEEVKYMKNVANKLGLNAEANEQSILDAIAGLENKAKDEKSGFEAKMKEFQKAKDDADEAMDKLKKEKDDAIEAKNKAETEATNLKKAKDDAEDEAKTEKVKNEVSNYAKIGKIKNEAESINFWTAVLKADFETGKKQLDSLPLNKIGAKIESAAEGASDDLLTSVAARAMAEVRNKLQIN
jgi:ATP-dependent protease ClpP protease subunit